MKQEIISEIENKSYVKVKQLLEQEHVPDISDLLEEIEDSLTLAKVFKLLSKDIAAEVFSYTSSETQEKLVKLFSDRELKNIIEDMYTDDLVDFIDEMPANIVERILKNATSETRNTINKFLKYEENTAGSVMTSEYLDVKSSNTVTQTINKIRKFGKDIESLSVIYVTNTSRVLEGIVSIRDILLADPEEKIEDIMRTNIIYENTNTDQEEIAKIFKQYDFLALPIVDKENRLVGIVTVDDVVHIIDEEATEDISKMNAISPNDKPYLKTNVFRIWLDRFPWLLLLMLSATFTGLIITKNEALLSKSAFGIILTACIPMLMGTGGNAGGQASATIIRGIALNEISMKDYFKVAWKEIRISILLGLSLAPVCFLKLLFLDGLHAQEGGVLCAAVVSLAMFITVVAAKVVGCSLPLIAKQCKLDPAVMASPFITTIIDSLSLLILCSLTMALLPI